MAAPAVVVERPVIIYQLDVNPGVPTPVEYVEQIPVPYAMCERIDVFIPSGTGLTVRLGFGYNGKKLVPSEDPDAYLFGGPQLYSLPFNIPVFGFVDVFVYSAATLPHLILIQLFMNYGPIKQAQTQRRLVTPA